MRLRTWSPVIGGRPVRGILLNLRERPDFCQLLMVTTLRSVIGIQMWDGSLWKRPANVSTASHPLATSSVLSECWRPARRPIELLDDYLRDAGKVAVEGQDTQAVLRRRSRNPQVVR